MKHPTFLCQKHLNNQHLLMFGSRHIRKKCNNPPNDIKDHRHRRVTSTIMTSNDSDIPSEHPGTETSKIPKIHMVAEPITSACGHRRLEQETTTSILDHHQHNCSLHHLEIFLNIKILTNSQTTSADRLLRVTTSSSRSSSGGHPPSAAGEQLDSYMNIVYLNISWVHLP